MINAEETTQKPQKPNIIWIFGDQMRAQATSYAGDPNVQTPNLDRLASEGFHFTHAVAGTPWCAPFRGALVTGRYPHRSTVPANNSCLSQDAGTIAHAFRENGYRTCWIGKWHLDGHPPGLDLTLKQNKDRFRQIPMERRGGFEDWWAYENNNRPFDCWIHTDCDGSTESLQLPGYESDALTDLLIGWMKQRVADFPLQPFFASLSVQPPHTPYVAPEEDMARHNPGRIQFRPNVPPVQRVRERASRQLAGYYAAIERLDWNVGRIRRELKELGISDNTYLVFFSDHGDMHGSHGLFDKSSPWEESIRIPFIIGGPSCEHQHLKKIDAPVNHVDIAPTTLGLCGIQKPDWMDGFDYSSFVKGEKPVYELPDSAYLSLYKPSWIDRRFRGIVTRDGWKYVALEGQPWLLVNLNEDPYEFVNVAQTNSFQMQRRRLQDRLEEWIEDTEDQFALPELD